MADNLNKADNLNLMIVGVGGQGTLLASRVIGNAAVAAGLDVKVSEVHGMSQRGGSVETYVRFGKKVDSPLVDKGTADVIICFEQLEALRFTPYLKKGGMLIVNTQVIDPMPVITGVQKYPEGIISKLGEALGEEKVIALDAASIALECGDIRAVNIVLLGVFAGLNVSGISREQFEESVRATVPKKALELNLKAFQKGYERGCGK